MASVTEEEENFVRLSLLLTGLSPRAVRALFDKEFPPTYLPSTLNQKYNKLLSLQKTRVINQAQLNLLFPRSGVADSKTFDVTLMICLIRHLTSVTPPSAGFDSLPLSGETTPGADLARIKWRRNYLAHLEDYKIDNSDFSTAWNEISDAVGRLGGKSMYCECQELKTKILDQSNREIMLEIKNCKLDLKISFQSFESCQESVTKEIKELKSNHEQTLKVVETLKKDNGQKTAEIETLKTYDDKKTKEIEELLTGHKQKEIEIEKLKADQKLKAKEIQVLKTDQELKTKEIQVLKTDQELNTKEIQILKTDQELKTKEIAVLKTDMKLKTKEIKKT